MNMDKKTKLILTIIGVAAIVVPVLLLLFVAGKDNKIPQVPIEKRQIDEKNVQEASQKSFDSERPTPVPTPIPQAATESAQEATPSGQ